jgi:hypothetical protein
MKKSLIKLYLKHAGILHYLENQNYWYECEIEKRRSASLVICKILAPVVSG